MDKWFWLIELYVIISHELFVTYYYVIEWYVVRRKCKTVLLPINNLLKYITLRKDN